MKSNKRLNSGHDSFRFSLSPVKLARSVFMSIAPTKDAYNGLFLSQKLASRRFRAHWWSYTTKTTTLQYDPEIVQIRLVAIIPTKLSNDKIHTETANQKF